MIQSMTTVPVLGKSIDTEDIFRRSPTVNWPSVKQIDLAYGDGT
jgi:hypothetical protein